MNQLITICGLPRAGSTLLQNVLAENPELTVDKMTSNLPSFLENLILTWSRTQETIGKLITEEDYSATLERILVGVVSNYYGEDSVELTAVSKSRGWNSPVCQKILAKAFPKSKSLVCVRDLRSVMASVEKMDLESFQFCQAPQGQRTLLAKAKSMFSQEGMVGSCITGIQDMVFRKRDVHFVKYEDFVLRPRLILSEIYDYLELPQFPHNINDVKKYAEDADEIYMGKFLHKGYGKIQEPKHTWKDYLDETFAQKLVEEHPWFYEHFYNVG